MYRFLFFADTDYRLSLLAVANVYSKFCAEADSSFLDEFSVLNY